MDILEELHSHPASAFDRWRVAKISAGAIPLGQNEAVNVRRLSSCRKRSISLDKFELGSWQRTAHHSLASETRNRRRSGRSGRYQNEGKLQKLTVPRLGPHTAKTMEKVANFGAAFDGICGYCPAWSNNNLNDNHSRHRAWRSCLRRREPATPLKRRPSRSNACERWRW